VELYRIERQNQYEEFERKHAGSKDEISAR
jgi:hypothetical protein